MMDRFFGRRLAPVADIREVDARGYVQGERQLRCTLAAVYRLVENHKWTLGIFHHITVQVGEKQHYLVNPFGLMYDEVTASSLLKVDINGAIVGQGSTRLGIIPAGFIVHAFVHRARPDLKCVMHFHNETFVAISSMKCGLLLLCQEAAALGEISYYEDYEGIPEEYERDRITEALGPNNKILILRNHGVVVCGETIQEAFHFAYNLAQACKVQVKAMAAGLDSLIFVGKKAQQQVVRIYGVKSIKQGYGVGEFEFEGWMRFLDRMGHCTGYSYRTQIWNDEKDDQAPEVADLAIMGCNNATEEAGPARAKQRAGSHVEVLINQSIECINVLPSVR